MSATVCIAHGGFVPCRKDGAHRFNDDGDCIFCSAVEPPLRWQGDDA